MTFVLFADDSWQQAFPNVTATAVTKPNRTSPISDPVRIFHQSSWFSLTHLETGNSFFMVSLDYAAAKTTQLFTEKRKPREMKYLTGETQNAKTQELRFITRAKRGVQFIK